MRSSSENGWIALAVGPIAAIVSAGILARFRDSAGSANVALVLAGVVIAAALAGRKAGAATAVTAALAYNFFHTKPYNSLEIHARHDVVTVVLLAVIGLAVGEVSAMRRQARSLAVRSTRAAQALENTASMLAERADPDRVWAEVRAGLVETLRLTECRYEPGTTPSVSPIARSGSIVASTMHLTLHGFQLPPNGAAIAVTYAARTLGHIVVVGSDMSEGSSIEERRAAVALADQLAVALATSETAWKPS